jgi:acyl-CoA reductase-like NAD-dependent aldehyde dehydrogenase
MLVNQTEEIVEPNEWLHVLSSPAASRAVAVVDRTADLDQAALAITEATFGFQGRSTYAPQAVLVNEFVAESLISRLVAIVVERSAGHRLKTQANGLNGQPREDRRTANSSANVGNIKTVVAGSYGTVVELVDR